MRDWTDRFLAKVRDAEDGCWEWTGSRLPSGYGRIWLDGSHQYTHRVAYEAVNGPIPDGLVIDHLCRNRACANPEHLEAVTTRTNVLRGVSFAAHKAQQTHCVHGHPFTTANTYRAPNGTRKCRTCRATVRRRSAEHRHSAPCVAPGGSASTALAPSANFVRTRST